MTMKQMYPFKENSAGVLRDRHKTGMSPEAMLAGDDILALTKAILPKDTYSKAEQLSLMLVRSKSERKAARNVLISVLLPPPKRLGSSFIPEYIENEGEKSNCDSNPYPDQGYD